MYPDSSSKTISAAVKYIQLLELLYILLPLFPLAAADNTKASVLTYMIMPEDETLITLGDVINDSIMLELRIAGFATPHSTVQRDLIEINKMLDSSRESGSKFLLLNSYELQNDQIKFKIDCYDSDNKELLISVEKEEQIGFFLDSAINESMTEVIRKIDENLPYISPLPEKPLIEPGDTADDKINADENIRQVLISAAVSPFMTTGKAGRYFTHGWEFYLFGGYPFSYKLFNYTAGIFLLVNRFNSEGVLISSENTFLSFGPEIRIIFKLNRRLSAYADISAGGTVFIMKPDVEKSKSAFIPNISSGSGIVNLFTQDFSGFFHLRYSLYFEESVLITGFSPALGVNINL